MCLSGSIILASKGRQAGPSAGVTQGSGDLPRERRGKRRVGFMHAWDGLVLGFISLNMCV